MYCLRAIAFGFGLFCLISGANAADSKDKAAWDIESPPGDAFQQSIDVDEGTWLSLDVSPDGTEIIFDLLGDIYSMPITGADGTNGQHPKKLTSGVAWDMQPRFSPDGQWIAFTSDRSGKSQRAGDNIWVMRRDGSQPKQVTNETFTLLNGPALVTRQQLYRGSQTFYEPSFAGCGRNVDVSSRGARCEFNQRRPAHQTP